MRIPIIPTIIVAAAIAVMVALGIWQLGRADEKAALLAQYAQAGDLTQSVAFPATGAGEDSYYRLSTLNCETVLSAGAGAGTSERGVKGWTHYATCQVREREGAVRIDLGFSRDPAALAEWGGGEVVGIIAPGPRLVAMPAQAGLEQLARPDPADLPNNHLAYAGQWFFFALTALVIYILALKRRNKG